MTCDAVSVGCVRAVGDSNIATRRNTIFFDELKEIPRRVLSYDMSCRSGPMFEKSETSPSA